MNGILICNKEVGEGKAINTRAEIREELVEKKSLFLNTGNQFVGNTDNHLTGYCTIDPLLPYVRRLLELVNMMVDPFIEDGVEAILSAGVGAIPLGHLAANVLIERTGRDVHAAFTERVESKKQAITRYGSVGAIAGRKLLVIDGIVNTTSTGSGLIDIGRELGCDVRGMSSIVANRGASTKSLSVRKFFSLTDMEYDVFTPEECADHGPCSERWPMVVDPSLGHGDRFQKQHPEYMGDFVTILPPEIPVNS